MGAIDLDKLPVTFAGSGVEIRDTEAGHLTEFLEISPTTDLDVLRQHLSGDP